MASRPTRQRIDPLKAFHLCETFKVSYPTYEAALAGAEVSMARGLVQPGCHLTPYKCERCSSWHVCNRRIVFL